MSRIEENKELLDRATVSFSGPPEKVMCGIEAQKLGILMDISKSLAILADRCLVEQEKSCKDCIYWLMNEKDERRRCRYCNDMDEFSPWEEHNEK